MEMTIYRLYNCEIPIVEKYNKLQDITECKKVEKPFDIFQR